MFRTEGVCDWCKKRAMVTKLSYIDGKSNYACQSCNEIAKMDIRLYNLEQANFIAQVQSQHTSQQGA